ncbi:MAG: nuclear transport factor 2 family protein [Christensenellales bacterium]|jgi:hypothetical protein
MNIRKPCMLAQLYADQVRPVNAASPELRFINAVCAGLWEDAVALFRERKLFLDEACAVDAPYGRYEGLSGIRAFAEGFVARFGAERASLTPMFQTVANGRVALEAVLNLEVDGQIDQVPLFMVADLRTPALLDELRIYTHFSFVPGLTPYRKPMFRSAHLEMGDPGLLTGAVRAYYEALHHAPYCDPEAVHRTFAPDCRMGGYEPWGTPLKTDEQRREQVASFAQGLSAYIPACVGMRYETLIDDGRTCVIEWVHIVSKQGQRERNRVCLSGVSAYERNDEGYLCSVRISDYAGYERQIDWSRTPISQQEAQAINLVEVFPAGCGRKPQQEP